MKSWGKPNRRSLPGTECSVFGCGCLDLRIVKMNRELRNHARDVDEYLDGLEADRRAALNQVRDLIREVVPEAVESIRYRMPTYEF